MVCARPRTTAGAHPYIYLMRSELRKNPRFSGTQKIFTRIPERKSWKKMPKKLELANAYGMNASSTFFGPSFQLLCKHAELKKMLGKSNILQKKWRKIFKIEKWRRKTRRGRPPVETRLAQLAKSGELAEAVFLHKRRVTVLAGVAHF